MRYTGIYIYTYIYTRNVFCVLQAGDGTGSSFSTQLKEGPDARYGNYHKEVWELHTIRATKRIGTIADAVEQWFLTWVWSNPRGSVNQFQGFGGHRFWPMNVKTIKFTTHILFLQLQRVRWMHAWNLWGSVPPTRLRTTGLDELLLNLTESV